MPGVRLQLQRQGGQRLAAAEPASAAGNADGYDFVLIQKCVAAELAQKELADDELTTVGTMISIEHISPTPIAAEVTAKAILKKIDGRMFYFDVEAYDKKGLIAKGTHTRVSVKAEKFQAKADGKFDD